jgi:hypothetical protein
LSSLQCWLTTLWSLAILNFHHLSISKPQSYLILTVHFICTLWKCPGLLNFKSRDLYHCALLLSTWKCLLA